MASQKQQMAIQIYMENRGISIGEAMRRAGYTESSAKNPKNLTNSASWQQMMDTYLPDIELMAKHNDLLKAKKLEKAEFPKYVTQEMIREILLEAGCTPRNYESNPMTDNIMVWYWAPDHRAQASALDLAYKLKGKLTNKVEHSGNVDGLFGSDALTITVVENAGDGQHPAGA